MIRGETRWYTFRPPDKRRPALLLGRPEVIDVLGEVIVVPDTRTIRGLPTAVVLNSEDEMSVTCALHLGHVSLAEKGRLGPALCSLPEARWAEFREALLVAYGFLPGLG